MTIKSITSAAIEDGVEDFLSAFVYRRMNMIAKPFLKEFEGEGEFNEAMSSFVNTLSIMFSIYALNKLMEFFFQRGIKIGALIWTYIVSGKLKQALRERLSKNKRFGKGALKKMSLILGADRTGERIEVAKMMQKEVNSYDANKFHFQSQSQAVTGQLDNFANPVSKMRNTYDNKSVHHFTHKTMTGTWKKNNLNKRLFERATGQKFEEGSDVWNQAFVNRLNSFSQFVTTAQGEIVNLQKAVYKLSVSHKNA